MVQSSSSSSVVGALIAASWLIVAMSTSILLMARGCWCFTKVYVTTCSLVTRLLHRRSALSLLPLGFDPPKHIAATAVAGARWLERNFRAEIFYWCVLSDPEGSPLLQSELRDDRLPCARAPAPLPSFISPRSHVTIRHVDLPLPILHVWSVACCSRNREVAMSMGLYEFEEDFRFRKRFVDVM